MTVHLTVAAFFQVGSFRLSTKIFSKNHQLFLMQGGEEAGRQLNKEALRKAIRDYIKKGNINVITIRAVIEFLEAMFSVQILGDSNWQPYVIDETTAFVEKWKVKLKRKCKCICSEVGFQFLQFILIA